MNTEKGRRPSGPSGGGGGAWLGLRTAGILSSRAPHTTCSLSSPRRGTQMAGTSDHGRQGREVVLENSRGSGRRNGAAKFNRPDLGRELAGDVGRREPRRCPEPGQRAVDDAGPGARRKGDGVRAALAVEREEGEGCGGARR